MLFDHTNYCFWSYFASRCATFGCSCVQLPGSCNLRPRRTTRPGIRHSANVTPVFCFSHHCSSCAPLLFSASVSHVCAFRVHGYLECTPVSRSAADRRLSWYFCLRWEVGQVHALCSLKSLFLQSLRVVIFYLWLWNSTLQYGFTIRRIKIFVKWILKSVNL